MTETVELKRRPLIELGSLSSVASFVAICVAIIGGTTKLNGIENNSRTNCQLLAGGIVLTLETSKARSNDPATKEYLDSQSARFTAIAKEC